ncbi:MAG TPA: EndoU domain-containing protein [Pseudonocardia sp.]
MAAGFSVQIDDLHAAAATFVRLHDEAVTLLSGARLADTHGMAGHDPVLAPWRGRYDTMAAAAWAASITATATLGAIATKLTDTADTYLAAEHAATPQPEGPPPKGPPEGPPPKSLPPAGPPPKGLPPGGGGAAAALNPGQADLPWLSPPSSTGSGGPEVPDLLAEYYPGGDPPMLRAAAAAWSALADGLNQIASAGDAAFRRLIATGDGAAFSAMRAFWEQRFALCAADPLLNAVINGAGTLSKACADLAELITRTRSEVVGAAAEAARDMAPLDLPAALLSDIAWGIPDLELLVGTGALALSYLNDYRNAYLFALDQLVERLRPEDEERLRKVAVPPSPDAPLGLGLTDVGQIAGLELAGSRWDAVAGAHPTPDTIHITPQRTVHILDGDKDGGGHAPGAGRPGKNEFPAGWSRDQIMAVVLDVARDPGTIEPTRQGRWQLEGVHDGVLVRVVVGPDGSLVTAIPVRGPGVVHNRP